jgi:hypothetical protein
MCASRSAKRVARSWLSIIRISNDSVYVQVKEIIVSLLHATIVPFHATLQPSRTSRVHVAFLPSPSIDVRLLARCPPHDMPSLDPVRNARTLVDSTNRIKNERIIW